MVGRRLRVQTAWRQSFALVSPEGELDVATIGALEREIDYALAEGAPSILTIDLRGVTFADARLLWLLLAYHADSRRGAGYELQIVRGTPEVQRLFELARLTTKFEFLDEPPIS